MWMWGDGRNGQHRAKRKHEASGRMAKRSATLKQFLLRVHPDHFRNIPKVSGFFCVEGRCGELTLLVLWPKVHDENLQSVKLLNQFMDEHHTSQRGNGGSSYHMRSRVGSKEKVYFSVMVPALSSFAESQEQQQEAKKLKRFSLELAANIEMKMTVILKECGVAVLDSGPVDEAASSNENTQRRRTKKRAGATRGDWQREQQRGPRNPSGMDFGGFTMGEMYAKANRAASASASRRRKKPIQNLQGLLEFMRADDTMATQKQRQIAWQSIQSVKRTLKRELGVEDVLTSCGWSTMHLNTSIMVLLHILRQYTRAHKQGIFTPKDFLRGATIDISSNPSGIDFANEYRIGLNPADVPLQWVEVLETIDADMVVFMKAARESLEALQSNATAALGEAHITRGFTCSALGYRAFLQSMRSHNASFAADYGHSEQGLLEKLSLVVEDGSYDWMVLETGHVQAPSDSSYEDVTEFLRKNRPRIRSQQAAHAANLEAFAFISSRCAHTLGATSITCGDGIPLADAIVACEELLKAVAGLSPQGARNALPNEMVRFVDTYTQGRAICISRSFGLGQDGVFTLPVDWYKW
ncbi:hypothetical protein BBJ28_00022650 [Nothophytophthora sp. Chile5]|nr:hypothetical protein BBJ28_00022650 [Nothophytophthora sp. Chile5]